MKPKPRVCRSRPRRPPLCISDILAWADEFRARVGRWPMRGDGKIIGRLGLTWCAVDQALIKGLRGLPPGSSLAKLLLEQRDRRHKGLLPRFTIEQILNWADAHHERWGTWPMRQSGSIPEAPGETWNAVESALGTGLRELPGGSSLANLLAEHRGVRNLQDLPALSIGRILQWADAHRRRTGAWPQRDSGPIPEAPSDTWASVDSALRHGLRSLQYRGSLPILLNERRGVRNHADLPDMSIDQIIHWAVAFHDKTGRWPTRQSGPITQAPEETWLGVDSALKAGGRGLPGGSSLPRLLDGHCGVRNIHDLPLLTVEDIIAWADAHHDRTGSWPRPKCGPIPEAAGETWAQIDNALRRGSRGLPRTSLARLLSERRGVRNHLIDGIRLWADAHHGRTGKWPAVKSGPIAEAPGETWSGVNSALERGLRGLPGASSLFQVLKPLRGDDE